MICLGQNICLKDVCRRKLCHLLFLLPQPEYSILLFALFYDVIAYNNAVSVSVYWIRPRGYKTFFMLNSVENEILDAH